MADFVKIVQVSTKSGLVIKPVFNISTKYKDIMIKGGKFLAVYDEESGLWSKNVNFASTIIDKELHAVCNKLKEVGTPIHQVFDCESSDTNVWYSFLKFISSVNDSWRPLDRDLTFLNQNVGKKDYRSKRLNYDISPKDTQCPNFEKIISTLYDPEERQKIEWAIGSIIAGDSKRIQKFFILYGKPGSGKSTILNIISMLFGGEVSKGGYCITYSSEALGNSTASFPFEPFRNNPLVGIEHEADLSKISTNVRLNSLIAHEPVLVNEKGKTQYSTSFDTMLFAGTNKPVLITDSKSGLIRRLIDISPSNRKLSAREYSQCMNGIEFELGAIARHCLDVYESLGINFYDSYKPLSMFRYTNDIYNFINDNFEFFMNNEEVHLSTAWNMFKNYMDDCRIQSKINQRIFKVDFSEYFRIFEPRVWSDGKWNYNVYRDLKTEMFGVVKNMSAASGYSKLPEWIMLSQNGESANIFDYTLEECLAQVANTDEKPSSKWSLVETRLCDIDTKTIHYVKPPTNLIVIDFDLKDENGEKSLERNLEAASKWPKTYCEVSKSGKGIHLHYFYDGDVKKLSNIYEEGIEIKTFTGGSSLRRKLSLCNSEEIAKIFSGLPLKEEVKKMVDSEILLNEKGIRTMIIRNLNKEIHASTTQSCNFIFKILEDSYEGGVEYDVSDLYGDVFAFANAATHQGAYCIDLVSKMHFKGKKFEEKESEKRWVPGMTDIVEKPTGDWNNSRICYYDVEIFPNLFVICYTFEDSSDDEIYALINPKPHEVEDLFKYRLVGFNNRSYDNHMIYAASLGYSIAQLYDLSGKIIKNQPGAKFGNAYSLSWTDIFDFAKKKQSLKKYEIEMGIHHLELGHPWDKPVPKELWDKVVEYCKNDVYATKKCFHYLKNDFIARRILAALSGLTVNDTTNSHTCRIIFGKKKNTQGDLVYTDLSKMFPGYKYEYGKSTYRGVEVGEGGYVEAQPGIHENVFLLDIASMHPTSIEQLNLFGPYTENFSELKQARVHIKHDEIDIVKEMFDGKLKDIMNDPDITPASLSDSLKIPINAAYGLTSAKFENPLRDPRNVDNIVAKRGALFMVNLSNEVKARGFTVAHIKTDSIKIPNATPEIIQFVMDYGKQYGYDFEHEATYQKMCLVNDAVYIAKYDHAKIDKKTGKEIWWTATGTQFKVPYVFKSLFSHEEITFEDMCEVKESHEGSLYLDFDEELDGNHSMQFVGKVGQFTPVLEGHNGGMLMVSKKDDTYSKQVEKFNERLDKIGMFWDCEHNLYFKDKECTIPCDPPDKKSYKLENGERVSIGKTPEKYSSASGAKGYRWLESEYVRKHGDISWVDRRYYEELAQAAKEAIEVYGDFYEFAS